MLPAALVSQERRAMTLEDVMGFIHIDQNSSRLNHDGSWAAYSASPDRGDGYGVLVSRDGETSYRIERATNPRFSGSGRWAAFTVLPPAGEPERNAGGKDNNNDLVLINTSDGTQRVFNDVKQASFGRARDILFIHHEYVEDTLRSEEENKKLEKAGTTLTLVDLEEQAERELGFVGSWTSDSLATTLVFTLADTLDALNGLYYLDLAEFYQQPAPLDTAGVGEFGGFAWFEQESVLAYMRRQKLEEDTIETAGLYRWEAGSDEPGLLVSQDSVSGPYFLPFDNSLSWRGDGQGLFFGIRPDRFAARPEKEKTFESETDSLRRSAAVDIWHGDDPLIKTHEKEMYSRQRRQNLLSLYDFDTGRIVPLACKEVDQVQPAARGSHVLASTNIPYSRRITWEGWVNDVYVIDLKDGSRTKVLTEYQGPVSLSPCGTYLLYFSDRDWYIYNTYWSVHYNLTASAEKAFYNELHDTPSEVPPYGMAGWTADGRKALVYDRYDIWLVDAGSLQLVNLTDGYGRNTGTRLRVRRLEDKEHFGSMDRIFIEGFNEKSKERALYLSNIDSPGVKTLHDTGMNTRFRSLSGDGEVVLFTVESQDIYPDLWVAPADFRITRRLSDLQQQLEEFLWGSAELVEYTSADGVPLQGVLIRPGDYEEGKKYPVFVYFYEKFSQRLHDFNQTVINHRPGFGYYTSNGYAVFLPDVDFIEGRPGMSAVKSLVPAVQKIIDMGVADPFAIGLHGHSWSGYQAAYVATQTDLFAAVIAGAPVSNMTSAYGGIRWGSGLARQFQYETGQSRIGSSIFDRRYLYIENSPLFYAHEINTPMLIMHGDADEAVPWEQSIELYLAMRRAGKDVIFLQYRDEPHHLQKYANKIDYTIRMKEFFDHHLRGKQAPGWLKEGIPYSGD